MAFALALTLAATLGLIAATARTAAYEITATVDTAATDGSLALRLGTQFVWPGGLDRGVRTRTLFNALAAPLVRINVATDTTPVVMPEGRTRGDWTFDGLDSIVNDVRGGGGEVVLTIAYAPEWMWDCPTGAIRDTTFGEFADYMARLVAYYNTGSFATEDGRTMTNPAGVASRIRYWELWNEPDLPTLGCRSGNPNISVGQYVAMWNAVAPKMLAIDPSIKLIGPSTARGGFVQALVAGATRKPDIVSFHAYGGWLNSQSDRFLFGDTDSFGLEGIVDELTQVKAWAPGIPIWITELNVNSAYDEDDPTGRPWNAYGAAWGASAFRSLAIRGVEAIVQYQFRHPVLRQLSLVDPSSGEPLLPYWRDYYLARYFPVGSTLLPAISNQPGIEMLAARPPGSTSVRVLVINRRTAHDRMIGPGVPSHVRVKVKGLDAISEVTVRMLDAGTPLDAGPMATTLPADDVANVGFAGYGAALLEFVVAPPAGRP